MSKWLNRWGSAVVASVLFASAFVEMLVGRQTINYITALYLTILGLMMLAFDRLVKRAFQVGWLKGRQAMLNSMAEATRRQMGLVDWVEAEMERDGFVVLREHPDATE